MPKIFIAGDFGYRGRTKSVIESGCSDILFNQLNSEIRTADLSILNFETPVGDSSHFIEKCGPKLCCDKKAVKAIKAAGFSLLTLANNHFFDCGQYGVEQTISACNEYGISYVGGGITLSTAIRPYQLAISGTKITIINVCETEFSIATDTHGGSAPLDIVDVARNIISNKGTSKVIVIVHGGHEFYQLPSTRMQKMYRFFIDLGASAIINHHQHCFSGYEIYNECPIFYGLGNFIFDSTINRRNEMWNYGYCVELDTENISNFKIIPYLQSNEEPGLRLLTKEEKLFFSQKISELNDIISSESKLKDEEMRFYSQGSISFLNPFYNGLTAKLYGKKWFPSFVSKNHRYYQLHYIQCESHRDILLYNLKKFLDI